MAATKSALRRINPNLVLVVVALLSSVTIWKAPQIITAYRSASVVAPKQPDEKTFADLLPNDFARAQFSGLMADLAIQAERNTAIEFASDLRDLIQLSIVACQDVTESTGWEVGPEITKQMQDVGDNDVEMTAELRDKYANALRDLAAKARK